MHGQLSRNRADDQSSLHAQDDIVIACGRRSLCTWLIVVTIQFSSTACFKNENKKTNTVNGRIRIELINYSLGAQNHKWKKFCPCLLS